MRLWIASGTTWKALQETGRNTGSMYALKKGGQGHEIFTLRLIERGTIQGTFMNCRKGSSRGFYGRSPTELDSLALSGGWLAGFYLAPAQSIYNYTWSSGSQPITKVLSEIASSWQAHAASACLSWYQILAAMTNPKALNKGNSIRVSAFPGQLRPFPPFSPWERSPKPLRLIQE